MHRARDELKQFLDDEQRQHREQLGMLQRKAHRQGELGDLIRQRVEDFSQRGDHIEAPGDFSVDQVCQAGNRHDRAGGDILIGLGRAQIDVNVDGNQRQPEQAQQIRNGENFLFPVLDVHGSFLRDGLFFIIVKKSLFIKGSQPFQENFYKLSIFFRQGRLFRFVANG